MITQINSENKSQYDVLFNKASNTLGKEISSLQDYFANLPELVKQDLEYARLPLDEECFKIDANTRTITIPSGFRKNGVGIQGDETAEVIYFKIDRYFDFMDLNNTQIYIQWKLENGKEGISQEWMRNILLDEDDNEYLTFGWVLGNNNITSDSGLVTFAISFIIYGEQNAVVYQLNTLETKIMVLQSLKLQNAEIENATISNLLKRLQLNDNE